MKKSLVNKQWLGRDEVEIEKGLPANPQIDHEYEPSLTDQTFNYSVADKVEDFIAAGQVIQAAAQTNNTNQYIDVEHSPFTFYERDLPEEQADIFNEINRISELLEKEQITENERKAMELYLRKLKEAGGAGDGV